jgi:hypothetical protein
MLLLLINLVTLNPKKKSSLLSTLAAERTIEAQLPKATLLSFRYQLQTDSEIQQAFS